MRRPPEATWLAGALGGVGDRTSLLSDAVYARKKELKA